MSTDDLHTRRVDAVRAWTNFVTLGDDAEPAVRPEIRRSWELSGVVSPTVTHAPLADETSTAEFWRDSPLQTAVSRVEDELRRTAEDGDLVIAVTDEETRILWTYGGRAMRRKAETVNFVPGGRWDEASVGTNALAIAGRIDAPSMVFSAEHYAEVVHNWVLLGGARARPGHRPAARRHRPLDHVGPHPPDRARHGPGDGQTDRDRAPDRLAGARRRAHWRRRARPDA